MLKLSDQEKREIIRYLEADRELPEKYRFLLFEDKREVELVWNGKTNEVCTRTMDRRFHLRKQMAKLPHHKNRTLELTSVAR